MNNNALIIEKVINKLLSGNHASAAAILQRDYLFKPVEVFQRNYTRNQKFETFVRDGFLDRYTGEKLLNPGVLKVLSTYFPEDFPYHPHWKMSETHIAYWELVPTIDHIIPIAMGGRDESENWATTSMFHNQIKNNWSLEQLHWKLHKGGDIKEWDGLTSIFIMSVEQDKTLLKDKYINDWYKVSVKYRTITE